MEIKTTMTQKELIVDALRKLGGRGSLKDIYSLAYRKEAFAGSDDWKATIRSYLLKETNTFRHSKGKSRGMWELVSFQEEIAKRDLEIEKLKAEVETLRTRPTEKDFVERLVAATKKQYRIKRNQADGIRLLLDRLGCNEAEADLGAWIENKGSKQKGTKPIVQKNINSQVFNGKITSSTFNSNDNE